jgi:hypothetical protein
MYNVLAAHACIKSQFHAEAIAVSGWKQPPYIPIFCLLENDDRYSYNRRLYTVIMNSILLFVGLYAHPLPLGLALSLAEPEAWFSQWEGQKAHQAPLFITEAALLHGIGLRI